MRTKQNKLHTCAHCNRPFIGGLETLHNLYGTGYSYICPDCFRNYFIQCDYCEQDVSLNEAYHMHDGRVKCPDCFNVV